MTPQTRTVVIVGSIVAALMAAVLVVGVLILNTMNAQASEEAYRACMARYGFEHDAPPPPDVDEKSFADAIVEAAERCIHLR